MALLDLVAFVAARLADRRRVALACHGGRWFSSTEADGPLPEQGVYAGRNERLPSAHHPLVAAVPSDAAALHIAYNDPAAVLRDVEADALVLDLYERALDDGRNPAVAHALERAVLAIAVKWRDHPDFVARWAR